MGKIYSVNTSENKGTVKKPVALVEVKEEYGILGDAHGGDWHRQLSLLDVESIWELQQQGKDINPGDFAENITTEGLDLSNVQIGDILKTGKCVFEITQIGKECHGECEIKKKIGECIMPKRGIFARVLQGGEMKAGDSIEFLSEISAAVLTLSDKGFSGQREDISGETIKKMIRKIGCRTVQYEVLPDEADLIKEKLMSWSLPGEEIDIIFTTGGTGFSKRDVTPEATESVLDREIPGFSEAMRMEGYKSNPRAILSRGVCGIKNETIIINLPGSVKGVREGLETILDVLPHAVDILKGRTKECGNIQ